MTKIMERALLSLFTTSAWGTTSGLYFRQNSDMYFTNCGVGAGIGATLLESALRKPFYIHILVFATSVVVYTRWNLFLARRMSDWRPELGIQDGVP